jgi:diaminohydroxyphosphoribosylaminopyrimidine deaminase/5-amino-6-(5-phosphoribosylamino)uracil reductase
MEKAGYVASAEAPGSGRPEMDPLYMSRCIQLARLGSGFTAPNPLVGAILVHRGRIIGEGYHQQFGGPHAEVRCIDSVRPEDLSRIPESTLYVCLEPCAHWGKTPPCSKLIIEKKIPRVAIGCKDPFPAVDGRGIAQLEEAGIQVQSGVLEKECLELNRRFFHFHWRHRPYVILKWAESADGLVARADNSRTRISQELTNRLVHRWRAEESAILVGTQTARLDNPRLNLRWSTGKDPVRLLIDRQLRLPETLQLFDRSQRTIVFNAVKNQSGDNLDYVRIEQPGDWLIPILDHLYQQQLLSVLVEGGPRLLQTFIDAAAWDEARVIRSGAISLGEGLAAPRLIGGKLQSRERMGEDEIFYFRPDLP